MACERLLPASESDPAFADALGRFDGRDRGAWVFLLATVDRCHRRFPAIVKFCQYAVGIAGEHWLVRLESRSCPAFTFTRCDPRGCDGYAFAGVLAHGARAGGFGRAATICRFKAA